MLITRSPHQPAAPPDRAAAITLALPDQAATEAFGQALAARARAGDLLLLDGPLGAGKSTLARAFLRAAMGDAALDVPSPSFTLVQSYALPGGSQASHYDLWRLTGPADLLELGFEEARAGIVLVEWPDRLGPTRPPESLWLGFEPVQDAPAARRIVIEPGGDWAARLAPVIQRDPS